MRTDPHRPSAIIPEDYEFVTCFGMSRVIDDWPVPSYGIEHTIELRKKAQEEGVAFCPIHDGLNVCDVCGAWFKDGAVWQHVPSGDYVTLGHTCVSKYRMAAEGGYGDALRDAKRLKGRLIDRAKRVAERRWKAGLAKAWLAGRPLVRRALALNHPITKDLACSLVKWGALTDKQSDLALKLERDEANRQPELKAVPIPVTDKRATYRGRVLGTKSQEGYYGGSTLKMLVQVPHGDGAFKLWGTAPESILFGTSGPIKGCEVEFTARIEPSKDDPCFGFFKRPTKGTVTDDVNGYKDTLEDARRFVVSEIAGVAPTAVIKLTADPAVPFCWLAEWDGRRAILYLDKNDFEEED